MKMKPMRRTRAHTPIKTRGTDGDGHRACWKESYQLKERRMSMDCAEISCTSARDGCAPFPYRYASVHNTVSQYGVAHVVRVTIRTSSSFRLRKCWLAGEKEAARGGWRNRTLPRRHLPPVVAVVTPAMAMMVSVPTGADVDVGAPVIATIVRAMAPMAMTMTVVAMTPAAVMDLLDLRGFALDDGCGGNPRRRRSWQCARREGDEAASQRCYE